MDVKPPNIRPRKTALTSPALGGARGDSYVTILMTSTLILDCSDLADIRLQKGDVIFCKASFIENFVHCVKAAQDCPFIISALRLNAPEDRGYLQGLGPFIIISPAMKASRPVINDILALIDDYHIKSARILPSVMERLLHILQSEALAALRLSATPQNVRDAFKDQKIAQSLSLIHADIHEDWSTARLAASVKMPARQFSTRFMELLKLDPETYILKWRLQKSITLLDGTALSIFDIAEETGFASEDKFRGIFFESFGLSPDQYRQKTTH